ncbi:MAG: LuxR family transcriptional regulator, partial [Micropruina sp.]|uniref:LuxR family transcriptional regulator n=1 Tax=Micropruina sp. TaxID=2737536 RepID=UPI0039E33171
MGKALAQERVRRDVEVLARAGLDLDTFVSESLESLRRAVPFAGSCVAMIDPSTGLLTGVRKTGALDGLNTHDHEWGLIEYGDQEPTAYASLYSRRITAAGVMAGTAGDPDESRRLAEFMRPRFGFADELRTICVDERSQAWAGVALFRMTDDPTFDDDEVSYLASLGGSLARGVRSGLLASLATAAPLAVAGPAVLIVGVDGEVVQASAGALQQLAELSPGPISASALVGSLVGAAQRYARGEIGASPRARVRG